MDALKHYIDVARNALRFYKDLFAERSGGAYLALGCAALVALFVFFLILVGYRRGGSRETTRLLFSGLAFVAAFFATCIIGRADFFDKSLGAIPFLDTAKFDPLLSAPYSVILLPFVFSIIFLIFNRLLDIPYQLICGIFVFTVERNNVFTRLVGACIGVLHGVLISIVLLLPCFGLIKPYADIAKNPSSEQAAAVSLYENYFEETAKSPLYRYTMRFGGSRILKELDEGNLGDLFLEKM